MKLSAPSHSPGRRLVPLLPLMIVLAACAPLQQAPLVYTSGVTIGLKVGVSPTQADAFETVIGFKMLDAAYVPVAVSKPDAEGSGGKSAPVHEIYGQFGEEITPEAVRQLNPGEMEAVKSYLSASADLSEKKFNSDKANADYNATKAEHALAVKADEDAKKRVDDARKAILALKNTSANICDFSDADLGLGTNDWSKVRTTQVKSVVDACVSKLQQGPADASTGLLKNAQELLTNANAQLDTPKTPSSRSVYLEVQEAADKRKANEAERRFNDAKVALEAREKSAMEALQKLANIRKRDALSVYGSFNGSLDQSVANKGPTIGSKLGKVFSTGVAAQNLTEAAKISATSEAFSQCVANLKDLAGVLAEDKREGFIKQAIENCGNGVKNTTADKKNA